MHKCFAHRTVNSLTRALDHGKDATLKEVYHVPELRLSVRKTDIPARRAKASPTEVDGIFRYFITKCSTAAGTASEGSPGRFGIPGYRGI